MLSRFKKLLSHLREVIRAWRTSEWEKLWMDVSWPDESLEISGVLTAAQSAELLAKRLNILIQSGLSKYEASWLARLVNAELESIAQEIECEKEEARRLAVNAYKFLEEQNE